MTSFGCNCEPQIVVARDVKQEDIKLKRKAVFSKLANCSEASSPNWFVKLSLKRLQEKSDSLNCSEYDDSEDSFLPLLADSPIQASTPHINKRSFKRLNPLKEPLNLSGSSTSSHLQSQISNSFYQFPSLSPSPTDAGVNLGISLDDSCYSWSSSLATPPCYLKSTPEESCNDADEEETAKPKFLARALFSPDKEISEIGEVGQLSTTVLNEVKDSDETLSINESSRLFSPDSVCSPVLFEAVDNNTHVFKRNPCVSSGSLVENAAEKTIVNKSWPENISDCDIVTTKNKSERQLHSILVKKKRQGTLQKSVRFSDQPVLLLTTSERNCDEFEDSFSITKSVSISCEGQALDIDSIVLETSAAVIQEPSILEDSESLFEEKESTVFNKNIEQIDPVKCPPQLHNEGTFSTLPMEVHSKSSTLEHQTSTTIPEQNSCIADIKNVSNSSDIEIQKSVRSCCTEPKKYSDIVSVASDEEFTQFSQQTLNAMNSIVDLTPREDEQKNQTAESVSLVDKTQIDFTQLSPSYNERLIQEVDRVVCEQEVEEHSKASSPKSVNLGAFPEVNSEGNIDTNKDDSLLCPISSTDITCRPNPLMDSGFLDSGISTAIKDYSAVSLKNDINYAKDNSSTGFDSGTKCSDGENEQAVSLLVPSGLNITANSMSSVSGETGSVSKKLKLKRKAKRFSYPTASQINRSSPMAAFSFKVQASSASSDAATAACSSSVGKTYSAATAIESCSNQSAITVHTLDKDTAGSAIRLEEQTSTTASSGPLEEKLTKNNSSKTSATDDVHLQEDPDTNKRDPNKDGSSNYHNQKLPVDNTGCNPNPMSLDKVKHSDQNQTSGDGEVYAGPSTLTSEAKSGQSYEKFASPVVTCQPMVSKLEEDVISDDYAVAKFDNQEIKRKAKFYRLQHIRSPSSQDNLLPPVQMSKKTSSRLRKPVPKGNSNKSVEIIDSAIKNTLNSKPASKDNISKNSSGNSNTHGTIYSKNCTVETSEIASACHSLGSKVSVQKDCRSMEELLTVSQMACWELSESFSETCTDKEAESGLALYPRNSMLDENSDKVYSESKDNQRHSSEVVCMSSKPLPRLLENSTAKVLQTATAEQSTELVSSITKEVLPKKETNSGDCISMSSEGQGMVNSEGLETDSVDEDQFKTNISFEKTEYLADDNMVENTKVFQGFQTIGGVSIQVKEESLKRAQSILMECQNDIPYDGTLDQVQKERDVNSNLAQINVKNKSLKAQNSLCDDVSDTTAFGGFSTAKGQQISVKEKSSKEVLDFLCEKGSDTTVFCGFSTVNGQQISVNEENLKKAQDLLCDDISDSKAFGGFSTAKGEKISVNIDSLKKAQGLLSEEGSDTTGFGGFSTVEGEQINVKKESLKKAQGFLCDENKTTTAYGGVSTGKGQQICVKEESLKKAQGLLCADGSDTTNFGGFSTGKGQQINVKEESLKKAQGLLCEDGSDTTAFGGFSTGKGQQINVKEESLKKAQGLLCEDGSDTTAFGGFSTGKGQQISVKEESLKKAQGLLCEDASDTTAFGSFSTVKGQQISVKEESLKKAKSFLCEDGRDTTAFGEFSTAKGQQINVKEESLKKAQGLLCEESNDTASLQNLQKAKDGSKSCIKSFNECQTSRIQTNQMEDKNTLTVTCNNLVKNKSNLAVPNLSPTLETTITKDSHNRFQGKPKECSEDVSDHFGRQEIKETTNNRNSSTVAVAPSETVTLKNSKATEFKSTRDLNFQRKQQTQRLSEKQLQKLPKGFRPFKAPKMVLKKNLVDRKVNAEENIRSNLVNEYCGNLQDRKIPSIENSSCLEKDVISHERLNLKDIENLELDNIHKDMPRDQSKESKDFTNIDTSIGGTDQNNDGIRYLDIAQCLLNDEVSDTTAFGGCSTARGQQINVKEEHLKKAQGLLCEEGSDTTGFGGFSTAKGQQISVKEESLKKAQGLLCEEGSDNAGCGGFSTAKGQQINVKEESLKKAQGLLREEGSDNTGFGGFSTAKGQQINVKEGSLKKAQDFLCEEGSDTTGFGSFSTAKGQQISVKEGSLKKAQGLLCEEGSDTTGFGGFSTAKGQQISVKEGSLKKAQDFLCEEGSDTTGFGGFSTAKGQQISVKEGSLKKAQDFLCEEGSDNTGFGGFSTAKGQQISVKEESLKKAQDFLCEEGSDATCFGGFSIAKKQQISVNEENLKKAHGLLCDDINDSKAFGGFSTAKGQQINVNEESLKKAQSFLCEEGSDTKAFGDRGRHINVNEENLKKAEGFLFEEGSDTTAFGGFSTAKGQQISINKESLKKAHGFLCEEGSDITGFGSFSTGNGQQINVKEESLKKTHDFLFEEVSDTTAFGGFSTAKGQKISVNIESLTKAQDLLCEDGSDATAFGGFSMAKERQISVNEENLKKAQGLLSDDISDSKGFGGFSTAKGQKISVNIESLKKAQGLLSEEDSDTTSFGSFSTVEGEQFNVKKESLKNAQGFLCEDGSDTTDFGGFSTAKGQQINVKEESLKKAQGLLCEEGSDSKPAGAFMNTQEEKNKLLIDDLTDIELLGVSSGTTSCSLQNLDEINGNKTNRHAAETVDNIQHLTTCSSVKTFLPESSNIRPLKEAKDTLDKSVLNDLLCSELSPSQIEDFSNSLNDISLNLDSGTTEECRGEKEQAVSKYVEITETYHQLAEELLKSFSDDDGNVDEMADTCHGKKRCSKEMSDGSITSPAYKRARTVAESSNSEIRGSVSGRGDQKCSHSTVILEDESEKAVSKLVDVSDDVLAHSMEIYENQPCNKTGTLLTKASSTPSKVFSQPRPYVAEELGKSCESISGDHQLNDSDVSEERAMTSAVERMEEEFYSSKSENLISTSKHHAYNCNQKTEPDHVLNSHGNTDSHHQTFGKKESVTEGKYAQDMTRAPPSSFESDDTRPAISQPGFLGFQTALGKQVSVSENSLQKARKLFDEGCEEDNGKSDDDSKNLSKTSFNTSTSRNISVSENLKSVSSTKTNSVKDDSEEVRNRLLIACGEETTRNESPRHSLKLDHEHTLGNSSSVSFSNRVPFSFQTALGKKVHISKEALNKATEILNRENESGHCNSNVQSSSGEHFVAFQTALGKNVTVSEKSVRSARQTLAKNEVEDVPICQDSKRQRLDTHSSWQDLHPSRAMFVNNGISENQEKSHQTALEALQQETHKLSTLNKKRNSISWQPSCSSHSEDRLGISPMFSDPMELCDQRSVLKGGTFQNLVSQNTFDVAESNGEDATGRGHYQNSIPSLTTKKSNFKTPYRKTPVPLLESGRTEVDAISEEQNQKLQSVSKPIFRVGANFRGNSGPMSSKNITDRNITRNVCTSVGTEKQKNLVVRVNSNEIFNNKREESGIETKDSLDNKATNFPLNSVNLPASSFDQQLLVGHIKEVSNKSKSLKRKLTEVTENQIPRNPTPAKSLCKESNKLGANVQPGYESNTYFQENRLCNSKTTKVQQFANLTDSIADIDSSTAPSETNDSNILQNVKEISKTSDPKTESEIKTDFIQNSNRDTKLSSVEHSEGSYINGIKITMSENHLIPKNSNCAVRSLTDGTKTKEYNSGKETLQTEELRSMPKNDELDSKNKVPDPSKISSIISTELKKTTIQPLKSSNENQTSTCDTSADDKARLEKARFEQDVVILKKKRRKILPKNGLLTSRKSTGRRYKMSDFVTDQDWTYKHHDQLFSLGVRQTILTINSSNAEDYRFQLADFYNVGHLDRVIVGDGALLVPDESGTAGKGEFFRSFQTIESVDPKLISKEWFSNHYRWVVWKLASYEVSLPSLFGGRCLSPDMVILQLKYRYDLEIDKCKRSAIKKIIERDDTPSKRMVLCVSKICPVPTKADMSSAVQQGETFLEVTDGWYCMKMSLNSHLLTLVSAGKIGVGQKLCICNAELTGSDAATDPLEELKGKALLIYWHHPNLQDTARVQVASSSLHLKVSGNRCRPVHWDTKLGYQRDPRPLCIPLIHITPDGGMVGSIDVVIARTYPIMYMEKVDGGRAVFRTNRNEQKMEQRHKHLQQEAVERVYSRLQETYEHTLSKGKAIVAPKKWSQKDIVLLDSGQDIHEAMASTLQPDVIQGSLSEHQMELLDNYRRSLQDLRAQQLQEELQKALANDNKANLNRNVTAVMKVRLVGCCGVDRQNHASTFLTIWRPTEDLIHMLSEGTRYRIHNANPSRARSQFLTSLNVHLSVTRSTHFESLKLNPEILTSIYCPRKVSTSANLMKVPRVQEYREVDVAGIVLRLTQSVTSNQRKFELLHAVDAEGDIFAVRFWGGTQIYSVDDLLLEGSVFAAMNLLQNRQQDGPYLTTVDASSEISHFSLSPQLSHLRESVSQLQKFKVSKGFLKEAYQKLEQQQQQQSPKTTFRTTPTVPSYLTNIPSSERVPSCENNFPKTPNTEDPRKTQKLIQHSKMSKLMTYGSSPILSPLACRSSPTVRNAFRPPGLTKLKR